MNLILIDMPLAQERQKRTPPVIEITCLSLMATSATSIRNSNSCCGSVPFNSSRPGPTRPSLLVSHIIMNSYMLFTCKSQSLTPLVFDLFQRKSSSTTCEESDSEAVGIAVSKLSCGGCMTFFRLSVHLSGAFALRSLPISVS